MSDLTDEEIIATRRLHGLDDGLYKETKMKDIEVGDYIRTKAGIVGKVIKVLSNRVFLDKLGYAVLIKDIAKHNKNLIDLIEVGDIIKYKINNVSRELQPKGFIESVIGINNEIRLKDFKEDKNREILEILTHELYETNCYKV